MENQVSTAAQARCGACERNNTAEAKFCAGCGQSLYENCGKCGKPVLLTQSYCGECGTDLDQLLRTRREQHDELMSEAVAAVKEHEYERAKSRLAQVAELTDYRFREQSTDAAKAIEKIGALEDRARAAVENATALARRAYQEGNQHEIVKHLSSVPFVLLGEEAKALLARAQVFADQWKVLEEELRLAIGDKNWTLVGNLVQQLLELDATHEPYRKLAGQVAGKLFAASKQSLDQGNYEAAVAQLDAIPSIACDEEIKQLRETADNIHWMSEQFDCEPFASPTLGRLAVRLAKETPKDSRTQKLVKQLAERLKQAPRPKRMHLPAWKGSSSSWLGGEVGVLGLPISLDHRQASDFKTYAGRWNVAIGLALQGLGLGRFSEDLLIRKKGLLSFAKRKTNTCWGVDIGSASIKAVRMQQDDSEVKIIDSYFAELEVPLCRRGNAVDERKIVSAEIERFIEIKQPGEDRIWVNLAGAQTVNRFVRLPPVKDKEAKNLLLQEVEHKIPIPLDELSIACWIRHLEDEETIGRPAIVTAARRSLVTARTDLIESCGLKISGMQSDTNALANFAFHEFGSLWSNTAGDEQKKTQNWESGDSNQLTKAVVLVDCGASATNLVIVSGESHWAWTIESAGEVFTNMIARSTKATHDEAEKLKRNPAALASPAKEFQLLEQRLSEVRARLETIFADAMRHNREWRVCESWCMGGGSQVHQWLRRIMLGSNARREDD